MVNYSGSSFSITTGHLLGSVNKTNYYSITTGAGANTEYAAVQDAALQLVVLSVDIASGYVDMYLLNPNGDYPDDKPATANASIHETMSLGTVNALRLYAGGTTSSDPINASCNIDELRIGTTWSDVVVSVPEPSTLVLLSCGLIGFLAYAWRKRK